MKIWNKLLAGTLAISLGMSGAMTALAEEKTLRQTLLEEMGKNVANVVETGDADLNLYQNESWPNVYTAMPAKYDMRDAGIVPPVRSQGNWGTCWGFASIAACEISLLSTLGLTYAQYEQLLGEPLDLSEKHLAWFAATHLPEATEGEEYIYPSLIAQAGEGLYQRDEAEQGYAAHYNNGGFMAYASSMFSAGIGPRFEREFPYQAADGTNSTASDWSLAESDRFGLAFEMISSHLLPSPAQRDENNAYAYAPWGTEAIKDEILHGRAVTIAYHADQAMDPDAQINMVLDQVLALMQSECDEENRALFKRILQGDMSFMLEFAAMSAEKQETVREFLTVIESLMSEEDQSAEDDLSGLEVDEQTLENARKAAEMLGIDYDAYVEERDAVQEAEEVTYINTETYAQYTDNAKASVNHAVCIIGWDDDYDVSNFLPDHQPPAAGAWIVRNSWGESYGNDGYFYLSYYDQTICAPESYEFQPLEEDQQTTSMDILAYDYMPASMIGSVHMKEKVGMANVFTLATDDVISNVSVMTADVNTRVTLAVYLLNEDATSPTDGVMLDSMTQTFLYGGYHRIPMNYNFQLPAGSRVSVVQMQRTVDENGELLYVVPYASATNQLYQEAQNTFEIVTDYQMTKWCESRIGQGESFVAMDGDWADWADIVQELGETTYLAGYVSIDNLAIKLYTYPSDEVAAIHHFGAPVNFNGVTAQICDDCGYTLVQE